MKRFFVISFLFIFYFASFAQEETKPLSSTSPKAKKAYLKATSLYSASQYNEAEKELSQAIEEDSSFVEAYLLLGDIAADRKQYEEAINYYQKALTLNPDYSPKVFYVLAINEQLIGHYVDAKKHFEQYLGKDKLDDATKAKILQYIEQCNFAIEAMKQPVPFNPINLGGNVNTTDDDFINAVTLDEQTLLYTISKITVQDKRSKREDDFYISTKADSVWGKSKKLNSPINTDYNEGALCISPDQRSIYFAACYRPDGYGSCDIYVTHKRGNTWSDPVNLGPNVNSKNWDSQPSISSDGKTLYFASTRPGGKGSSDIWKTTLQENGEWSTAENLGDSINTSKSEMAPYIHADNRTLYFSSDGHLGMGKKDLFVARKSAAMKWKTPMNLGYPINTYADENTFVVNAKGDKAYFSSDKLGGKGKYDIYCFDLYEKIRPEQVTFFKGIVINSETKKRLQASVELYDLNKKEKACDILSDSITGEFTVCLTLRNTYAFNVSKRGYLFYSDNLTLDKTYSELKPFTKEIALHPIGVGAKVILKNIFFDTDKYALKEESLMELNKLVDLMKNNPTIKIEVSGHTDNVGNGQYNLTLSEQRAKAVYDYLITKGIASTRLTFKGYGLTQPIDVNTTPEGRANNRRTEFKVIEE